MTQRPIVRFLDRSTPPHLVTLVLLAGLPAAAMNIYLPSLANMTTHFGTDYRVMQLSVTLYLAINAVLQLFIGPISDRFGRRPVVLVSFALFALATVGTLLAPTAEAFLIFRMLQSFVVTGTVLSRAVVGDMVPKDEAASMIGYVTMGMALVPMVSPVIGGTIDEFLGWQANFVLLLVLAILVTTLVWFDMGETMPKNRRSSAAQLREVPALFSSPRFWGYNIAVMTASGTFFAYLGGAPFVGSQVFGLSPAKLGLLFGMPAIGYIAGNALTGMFSVRLGIDRMMMIGTIVTCIGIGALLLLFSLGFGSAALFFGFMVTVGFGNGMVLPNGTAGMLAVRPNLAGTAAGVGGAVMIGGGAALSALAGSLLVPGAGPLPLLWIMFLSSCASVAATFYVMSRARQITR